MNKYILLLLLSLAAAAAAARERDSLQHYTRLALRDNPGVKAAYHAYLSALHAVPAAGALDDPVLEAGFFPRPLEYADGREVARFQVMQMFPWFGTRRAARAGATRMSRAALEQFRERVEALRVEVSAAWHALCLTRQRWLANEEQRQYLEQLERLAMQRFTAATGISAVAVAPREETKTVAAAPAGGMAGMSASPATGGNDAGSMSAMNDGGMITGATGLASVLQLQAERAALESEAGGILSELAAGKAAFNALLDRPPASDVVIPDSCSLSPLAFDATAAALLLDERNPMLAMIREEQLAAAAETAMTRKMGYPMLGVGVQYMLSRPLAGAAAMSGDHAGGMDMIMPMLTVTLPVSRGKRRAAVAQARHAELENEQRYRDARRRLEAELHRHRHAIDEAAREIALARRQATLARSILELSLRALAAGQGTLDDVIRVQRQLAATRRREISAIIKHNAAIDAAGQLVPAPLDAPTINNR
ncbi:MAG: TolC family protein [Odoribacteraceae bacterium]|jgi:outer membrane protein TolC|nr:TolC family protein [Odoribacteraceae bacterium]